MFDLDAYLRRVNLPELPVDRSETLDLAVLHRAHVSSIPFENLDPRRGVRVQLDPETLQAKLVAAGRGGYCFEHNLLFAQALRAAPAALTVEPLLARVRWGRPPEADKPLTHLLLRVTTADGTVWHADVGFGNGTLLEPIPFGVGGPYEQSGWVFRVVAEGAELVLQTHVDGDWRDVYAIRPEPAQAIDIELGNWYTSTHPDSVFVRGLVITRNDPDGTRTLLSDLRGRPILTVSRPGAEPVETELANDAVPDVLASEFGLPADFGRQDG